MQIGGGQFGGNNSTLLEKRCVNIPSNIPDKILESHVREDQVYFLNFYNFLNIV